MPSPTIILGVTNLAIGSASLVNGIIGGQTTKDELREQKAMLSNLQTLLEDVQKNLRLIMTEIHWTQVIVVLADSITTIEFKFNQLNELSVDDSDAAKTWRKSVNVDSVCHALYSIDAAIMGKSAILSGALFQILAEKYDLLTPDKLQQSKGWLADDYFLEILEIQAKGYAVLFNACSDKDESLLKAEETKMEKKFKSQFEYSKKFINSLPFTFQNHGWGEEYFKAKYVDTHEIVADSGKVVVGLQLYLQGNRICLKIAQATPEFDDVEEKMSESTWMGKDWANYFNLHYVDSNQVILPEGMVVTGAALYCKGNRMAIKLQGTKINALTGKLDGMAQWHENKIWGKYDHFKTQYCDDHQVIPSPLSCINGAAIYEKGNRIAVEICTIACRCQTD